jgi:methionine sulfoxide reductase heme-binding subunit
MTGARLALIKALVWIACLAPLLLIVARGFGVADSSLGANPVEEVLHTLGKTALNLMLITLAVTPARIVTGLNWLVRLRRLLGLFCFFYALLHLAAYAVLDQRLDLSLLLVDVTQRPYITVGFLAVVLMLPLAITSTSRMQRRLGRRWVTLHRLIYPAAVLSILHFWWQTKIDVSEPLLYAFVLALLLGYRAARFLRRRRAAAIAGR